MEFTSPKLKVGASFREVNDFLYERGATDGLPIVPPTPEAVAEMLSGTSQEPSKVIGFIPPRWGEASIERIAVNAVMAGCRPEYLPVLIAAVEGMVAEGSALDVIQATTAPLAPAVIVHGPVRQAIGVNCGSGCMGPGTRANATIGRAVRLVLMNVGGGLPGKGDMATMGQPSKYCYCFGENQEASPWEPMHVERGLRPEDSAVTIAYAENPHNINDHICSSAEHILTIAAHTIATMGVNFPQRAPVLVLCPEHASVIGSEGWSKDDVKRFIHEHARLSAAQGRLSGMYGMGKWPGGWDSSDPDARIPVIVDWKDIAVLVAGGPGKHSCYLPSSNSGSGTVTILINE